MDTFEVMRTAFAARDYTPRELDDATLYRILEHARFSPSGGNRQGWHVIVLKDRHLRHQLADLMAPTIKQYKAQAMKGETPFSSVHATHVTQEEIDAMSPEMPFSSQLADAPAALLVTVDLAKVTAFDQSLDRVAVVPGASIYPFAWNIILAARNEGFGGVLTTFLANHEPEAKALLGIPETHAIACLIGLGEPVKQLTKLKRRPVDEFATVDHWQGHPFNG